MLWFEPMGQAATSEGPPRATRARVSDSMDRLGNSTEAKMKVGADGQPSSLVLRDGLRTVTSSMRTGGVIHKYGAVWDEYMLGANHVKCRRRL